MLMRHVEKSKDFGILPVFFYIFKNSAWLWTILHYNQRIFKKYNTRPQFITMHLIQSLWKDEFLRPCNNFLQVKQVNPSGNQIRSDAHRYRADLSMGPLQAQLPCLFISVKCWVTSPAFELFTERSYRLNISWPSTEFTCLLPGKIIW